MSRHSSQNFKGFLPEPSFVMAKKKVGLKKEAAEGTSTASFVLEGNKNSELAFVIARSTGGPYDGRAGQLLQKMIVAMGVKHTDVLMISIDVTEPQMISEMKAILAKTKILVVLGEPVARYLLQTESTLGHLRGNLHPFDGVKLIASFHPADLLNDPSLKKDAWEDLKVAVKELGWKLPDRGV